MDFAEFFAAPCTLPELASKREIWAAHEREQQAGRYADTFTAVPVETKTKRPTLRLRFGKAA